MDAWLASLSRGTIAILAIVGGTLYIVLSDPPNTVCGAQTTAFYDSQIGFLYPDEGKFKKTSDYEKYSELCKRGNNPGGCLELFVQTRAMLGKLKTVGRECWPDVGSKSKFKTALYGTMDVMARLAWGEKPPRTPYDKRGWLDDADIALFCRLNSTAVIIYGQQAVSQFHEKYFKELPGLDQARLKREDVWARMLFSTNCRNYR